MKKFENVLICTDLDGTLLGSDNKISRENLEAIEYFKSEGGFFTFITGRMPSCAEELFYAAKPNVPFGCINGGGLYDGVGKKYINTVELDKEALLLVEYVDKEFPEVGIQIDTFENIYFSKESTAMQWFRKVTGKPNLVRHYQDVNEPMAKVVFGDMNSERISRLAEALDAHPLGKSFSFTRSESYLYEILPKGINKSAALTALCAHLGIPIERSIALGDYNNDVEMLGAAGIGIAVANATDAAKAVADVVTVSNDEHAVARVIYGLENGEIKLK